MENQEEKFIFPNIEILDNVLFNTHVRLERNGIYYLYKLRKTYIKNNPSNILDFLNQVLLHQYLYRIHEDEKDLEIQLKHFMLTIDENQQSEKERIAELNNIQIINGN